MIGEPLRADVALNQEVIGCEVLVLQQARLTRFKCDFKTLFIDLTVTGNQDCGELFRQGVALLIDLLRVDGDENALQSIGSSDLASEVRTIGPINKCCDCGAVRRLVNLRLRLSLNRLRFDCRNLHGFHIGGVLTVGGDYEGVFATFANSQELLGGRTAHSAGGSVADFVLNAQPVKNTLVGTAVQLIRILQPLVVHVEGVGVLHHELAATQNTRARAGLVAVLGLNLEQRRREILVGAEKILDSQREHLFVRRPQQVVRALAILQTEQLGAIFGPPIRRLVRFTREQCRECQLLCANAFHLLAHNLLYVAQNLQAQWQPGVHTRGSSPDVAGTDEQLVARDLGVSGILAQCA